MTDTSIPATPLEPASSKQIDAFRIFFPEFKQDKYTDAMILPQLKIAGMLVSKKAFGEMYLYAVCLLTAHFLVLQTSAGSNASGFVTGNGDGIVSNKAVGEVSVGYLAPAGYDAENALSSTQYGRIYLSLVKLFGVGAVQL